MNVLSGPISNFNTNGFNALQRINGGQLDANKATELRQAFMADKVIDAQEAQFAREILNGATSMDVTGRDSAGFEPLDLAFDGVSQAALGELDDILALYEMQQEGFIQGGPNGRSYDPEALADASASEINELIDQLSDNPGENGAPLFYLKVAGANLTKQSERDAFIQQQLGDSASLRRDMSNMHNMLKRVPGQEDISSALTHIAGAMRAEGNTAAASQFLEDIDFTHIERHNPQGTSGDVDDMWFRGEALEARNGAAALPPEAAEHLSAVLSQGDGFARRAGTHLNFHMRKLGQ